MHIAARRGDPHMIRLLLSEGADPVSVSKVHRRILKVGSLNGQVTVDRWIDGVLGS